MGKTKKHIAKGKFKNRILSFNDCDITFKMWCNRKNGDWDEQRANKKKIIERIHRKLNKIF